MAKIMNLVIEDRSDPKETKVMVEPFFILKGTQSPEQALRDAVKEFVCSETEESQNALVHACGGYNWADAISSVPDSLFVKHAV